MPATIFPMPWPTSSLSESCCVLVMESDTRDVSRLSIEPSNARMNAGCTICAMLWIDTAGTTSLGRPDGTWPITGKLRNASADTIVPMTRTPRGAGTILARRDGQNIIRRSIAREKPTAPASTISDRNPQASAVFRKSRQSKRADQGMEYLQNYDDGSDTGHKSRYDRSRCIRNVFPSRKKPNNICSTPPIITIVNASGRLPAWLATTAPMTTVMGPVGPDTCAGVPPNNAAKKPVAMAPYNPAIGPTPEETPKASARGSATTAAVNPPKRSLRKLCAS